MSSRKGSVVIFATTNNSLWLRKQARSLSKKYKTVYVFDAHEKEDEFRGITNIQFKQVKQYHDQTLVDDLRKNQCDFVNTISKKLIQIDSLISQFFLEKINTWWFLPNKIFGQIRDYGFITIIDALNNALKDLKPSLVISDPTNRYVNVLLEICKNQNIKYKLKPHMFLKIKNGFYKATIHTFAGPKRWFTAMKLMKWAKKSNYRIEDSSNTKPTICYLSHAAFVRFGFTLEGKLEKHDVYQKNIKLEIDKLGDFNHYSIEVLDSLAERSKFDEIHTIRKDVSSIPLDFYQTFSQTLKTNRYRKIARRRVRRLFKNTSFLKLFNFQDVSIAKLHKFQFKRMFTTEMSNALEKYYLFIQALNDIKPKTVILHNEHTAFGKALTFASKTYEIPTIAIQHGFINFASPEYIVYKDLICDNLETELQSSCNHIAATTLVHGKSTEEILTKFGGYPSSRVKIVGSAQWDIIKKKEYFKRKEFLAEIGFDSKKKTLVVLSQALPIPSKRMFFNENLIETIKKHFSDLQVIWKPHPRENEHEIADLVHKHSLTNTLVRKELSLFDVLNSGDVAITVHSTTGLEAMFFDKPVITFIPPGERENSLFKDTGSVIRADDKHGLEQAIRASLFDDKTKNSLKENRTKLIKKLVKFDGKASNRIANFIVKLMKDSE